MAEIVVGRFRPTPGTKAEDLELPGPGKYEADFKVPGWLMPDFTSNREFDFTVADRKVQHLGTTVRGDLLTVRFRVEDTAPTGATIAFVLPVLTIGLVVRAVFGVIAGALVVKMLQGIVDALVEVRKLAQTPGALPLTIGLGALALAGAAAWLGFKKGG